MGQEENRPINFSRVESIEVIKLTDTERIKELCPSGYVYDLEITSPYNIVTRVSQGQAVISAEVTQ